MNFDKESKSWNFFFLKGGGGGWCWGAGEGGYGSARYEHKTRHIVYTRHIVRTSSTEQYSRMKIFLTVFKIEGIVIHNFVHERVPCDTEFSLPSCK